MKNKSLYGISVSLILITTYFILTGAHYLSPFQESGITGTWISDEDSRWKLIFTDDNKCYQYYEGSLTETDNVIISNNSPQCGIEVTIETSSSYLQLINSQNANDKICYLINGISNTSLSLSVVGQGNLMVFTRQ